MSALADYSRFLPSRSGIFAPDLFDRDLIRDFLFLFSRAEFALKAAGFVVPDRRYGDPKVQWQEFAASIEAGLNAELSGELQSARRYLVEHPPQKQIVVGRALAWQDRRQRAGQSGAQFLIESVTQVRHNLFHGSKELAGRLAERDRALISAATLMGAFAVSLHGEVSAAFEDVGPRIAA